jgi:hypothetical protein
MSHPSDFIDEDLRGRTVGPNGLVDPAVLRRAQQDKLASMGRQRERLEEQVATTAQELERLRQQQESLERQKQTLEALRRRQVRYLDEKKEMGERLQQSIVLLEKEEQRVSQLVDLYADSRERFDELHRQLETLEEGGWTDSAFENELGKALDGLKAVRVDFGKTLGRLDALGWDPDAENSPTPPSSAEGFLHWARIGLAIAIPFALLLGLTALAVAFLLTKLSAAS